MKKAILVVSILLAVLTIGVPAHAQCAARSCQLIQSVVPAQPTVALFQQGGLGTLRREPVFYYNVYQCACYADKARTQVNSLWVANEPVVLDQDEQGVIEARQLEGYVGVELESR